MQFSTITIFALAAVATAAPAEVVEVRTTPVGSCTNSQPNQVCCSNGLLGCLIPILGQTCGGQAYCCSDSAINNGVVTISALNCFQLF
ncbi:hypothetical protein F4814DRAFT_456946 [Daldinia grandis]|nr:hypothetical protein F4814DRAFT_456946 [Daldinia grandis]